MLIYALIGWFVCYLIGKVANWVYEDAAVVTQFSELHRKAEQNAFAGQADGMLNFIKERCKPFTIMLVDRLLKVPQEQWMERLSQNGKPYMSVDLPEFHFSIKMDEQEVDPFMAEPYFARKENGAAVERMGFMDFSPMERFLFFMSLSTIYYKVCGQFQHNPTADFYNALKTEPVKVPQPSDSQASLGCVSKPWMRGRIVSDNERLTFYHNGLGQFAASINANQAQMQFIDLLANVLVEKSAISKAEMTESPFTAVHPKGVLGVFECHHLEELIGVLKNLGVLITARK